jgi:hypothetical protein
VLSADIDPETVFLIAQEGEVRTPRHSRLGRADWRSKQSYSVKIAASDE